MKRGSRSESTYDYFEATRSNLETHGKPVAFYSHKLSVFHVAKDETAHFDGIL